MNEEEYRSHLAINWSLLKSLRVSPKQFQHDFYSRNKKTSTAMVIGTAIHTLVLEGEREFNERFAVYDGKRDKRTKAYQGFLETSGGRSVLSLSEYERICGAAEAVRAHPAFRKHIEPTEVIEQAVFWVDDETGIECKGRCDVATTRLVELKTTGDIDVRRFAANAARLGYHGQVAFYEDGLRTTGYPVSEAPIMIVVQQDPPFDVITYMVPNEVVDMGRRLYRNLLFQLRECRESGRWPGIAEDEISLNLPAWAETEALEEEPTFTMGGVALSL